MFLFEPGIKNKYIFKDCSIDFIVSYCCIQTHFYLSKQTLFKDLIALHWNLLNLHGQKKNKQCICRLKPIRILVIVLAVESNN